MVRVAEGTGLENPDQLAVVVDRRVNQRSVPEVPFELEVEDPGSFRLDVVATRAGATSATFQEK